MRPGAGLTALLIGFLWAGPGLLLAAPGVPRSPAQRVDFSGVDHRQLPRVDVRALLVEDRLPSSGPRPRRVALPQIVDLHPGNAGSWSKRRDGSRVWRLRVTSRGAIFTSYKFSDFRLPPGAELYFISVDRDYEDGPYGSRHNRAARRFGSPMVPGDSAVIELYLPRATDDFALVLESVSHGYRNVFGMSRVPARKNAQVERDETRVPVEPAMGDFGCQRDINCPEGADYQDDKRAAAEGYDGSYICSGGMINNAREDCRYLYITAEHCEWWQDPAGMAFYWNYENSGCGNHDAPLIFSTGSTDLYHDTEADIQLMELDGTDLESTYDIYFEGWSRRATPPTEIAMIGFPDDKPKQIAADGGPILDCLPNGCPNGWGPNFWRVTEYDVGMPEGGSSGSPLLDQEHRVIGVLTGGVGTDCNDFGWDEYGKLHVVWDELQPFLDPDNSGVMSIAGRDNPTCDCELQTDVTPNAPQTACSDAPLVFTATPNGGTPPYEFQWVEDGLPLADGSEVFGATTPVLTISRPGVESHDYNCRITDESGNCPDVEDVASVHGSWDSCIVPPPPVGDGTASHPVRLGKSPDGRIEVRFDRVTCSAERAVVVWGAIGDFSGYSGDTGPDCDLGNSGSAVFDPVGDNVWFNLLWVNGDDAAGSPGPGSAGPRPWPASGLCGIQLDDLSDSTCD